MSTANTNKESIAHIYKQIPTSHYLNDDHQGTYYTGDYKIGLNFFSFAYNLESWFTDVQEGGARIDTLQAIRFAKEAGFDTVDITAYYLPGYERFKMPSKSDEEIFGYARKVKNLCDELGIIISGTGVKNDFAVPSQESRALDVEHVKYWIDVAAVMGAPVMRVFSGLVPEDIESSDWETIARDRIVPALRECASYGAQKGVKIGVQNHGDMMATADQVIRILKWVDHPNLGVVNDTGYFRPFQSSNGVGYDWYDDIEAILPYTVNFQIKRKPAGYYTDTLMDLEQLFIRIRRIPYRGYLPFEMIWENEEAEHPRNLSEPPYKQISDFLALVKSAAEITKSRGTSSIDPFPATKREIP